MDLGKRLVDTCWETYRRMPTGLSPEITYFNLAPGTKEDLIVKVSNACKGHMNVDEKLAIKHADGKQF